MRVFRQEVRTGALVIVTIGILTLVLMLLSAPGIFSPLNTYHIFFDDAGGIKQGGPVLLAGVKIGQVTRLKSPVRLKDRPANFKQDETLVEIQVTRTAEIYRDVTVRMEQSSLLGDVVIDFTSGVEESGLAPNGSYFIGDRTKSFAESIAVAVGVLKQQLIPVAQEATKTLASLRETSNNLQRFTAPGSDLEKTVDHLRSFSENLVDITKSGSPLTNSIASLNTSLEHVNKITGELASSDQINVTLANFQKVSANLDKVIMRLGPSMEGIANNARDFTNVIKRQPWRLIWHSTVTYPGDAPQADNTPEQPSKKKRDRRDQ